jgi:hypothetical protein
MDDEATGAGAVSAAIFEIVIAEEELAKIAFRGQVAAKVANICFFTSRSSGPHS